jgi:Lon protease-like protein
LTPPPHQTRTEDLPTEFGVFPLPGALLLPRGRLPLNIFEPRYLALTEDALGTGRMFGMIQPHASAQAGCTGPRLFHVGCLGRLTSFSETDDGRYLITLTGVIRFAVAEELPMRCGFRRVRADFAAYLADLAPEPPPIGVKRARLLDALRRFFARRGFDANWEAINRMPDDALVVTLCMVCPFEPAEKQALLEVATEANRAGTLLALLEMGAADPAAEQPKPAI